MHLNLPDGTTMLGREYGGYQFAAMDEQVQVNLPIDTEQTTSSGRSGNDRNSNNSDKLALGQEYLMGLAAGRGPPDEEHVDLSSLNDEVCSEYEE